MEYKIYLQYKSMAVKSRNEIKRIQGLATGKQIFIIGTGPSLQWTDLKKIDGEIVIFLNNAITLAGSVRPSYAVGVVSDHLRAIELRRSMRTWCDIAVATTDKVFNPSVEPTIFSSPYNFVMPKVLVRPDGRYQVSAAPGFSESPLSGLYLGKSVLFPAIQLAYYMKPASISLVGIDMTIGAKAKYYDKKIKSNWSEFNYARDGRPHISVMRDCLRERGIALENLTIGGAVDVLSHDPVRLAIDSLEQTDRI